MASFLQAQSPSPRHPLSFPQYHILSPHTTPPPPPCQALFKSTVQLVLLPTVGGLALNEFFKKQVDVVRPLMPLIALALTVVLCAVPVAQVGGCCRCPLPALPRLYTVRPATAAAVAADAHPLPLPNPPARPVALPAGCGRAAGAGHGRRDPRRAAAHVWLPAWVCAAAPAGLQREDVADRHVPPPQQLLLPQRRGCGRSGCMLPATQCQTLSKHPPPRLPCSRWGAVSIETGMQSAAMGYALSSKHFAGNVLVAVPSSISSEPGWAVPAAESWAVPAAAAAVSAVPWSACIPLAPPSCAAAACRSAPDVGCPPHIVTDALALIPPPSPCPPTRPVPQSCSWC